MSGKFARLLEDSSPLDQETSSKNEADGVVEIDTAPPHHRVAAALLLEGKTPEQIAEVMKMEVGKVKTLLQQPQTQEAIKQLAEVGDDSVENLLKATEIATVLKLIELRDDQLTPASTKLACCKELLRLRHGNDKLKRSDEDGLDGDVNSVVEELDRKIESLMNSRS
jgi:hypothetical protein